MKLFGYNIGKAVAATSEPKKGKRMSENVNKPQPYRVNMQMSTLREAVETARDIFSPSWIDLYEIYRNAMTDAQVRSQVETAINKVQASPFILQRNDADNDELTKLFEKPWFSKLLKILIDAEMWGYTVAEFGLKNKDGEFKDVRVFPRTNIYPHNRNIIIQETDRTGIPYGDKPEKYFLLEIGSPDDLGLLELISREVIWKAFARRDWSELGEKWGTPRLVIKTDAEGAELTARQTAAANFGHNGYMITDNGDEIMTLESKNSGNGYLIFEKHIRLANEEISKLINGQTGTSDDMAYVGSAEVHERILNDYHAARLRRYTNFINYDLIPFLIYHGYPLQEGDTIRFTELDPETFDENKNNINPEDPNNPDNEDDQLPGKATNKKKAVAAADPLTEWLKRFYSGVEGLDPEIWELNFNSLLNAMRQAGIAFGKDYEYAALAKELQKNAAVFAAFKNHEEQNQLLSLLVDEAGEPRSLNAFIKAAKPLTEKYNKEYLITEFKQAQASAQMAVKWEGFSENADMYPNLQYRSVGDADVRPEHQALNGLIAPINDPVWNSIYPPNGWGCRCNVTQTDKSAHIPVQLSDIKPDKGFEFNPGKDRKLFSDESSYGNNVQEKQRVSIEKQATELLKQRGKK